MSSFILKGAGRLNWAYFKQVGKDEVEVVALLGLVEYIDRVMDIDEARLHYRKLCSEGWHKPTPEDGEPPSPTVLKYHIYD